MIGTTLGHYEIVDRLGAGGMGEVYLAQDKRLGREVAIKVLPPEFAADPERLDRFQREARTLAALDHPNIVHLYSVEEADGLHFLTMQLVRGQRLSDRISDGGMSPAEFFEIAVPLADALGVAHETGIIHRDLKPGNVMIDDDGRVKVLDFGLAKLRALDPEPDATRLTTQTMTREGSVLGTMPYMSPEQVQGKLLDHRTDTFSLGVLFYEMLTGGRPFRGENSASVISSILRDDPPSVSEARAGLPARLDKIVARCLEKNPADRYRSARNICRDLEDLRAVSLSAEAHRSATPIFRSGSAMPRRLAAVLGALAVVGALFAAFSVWDRWPAAPAGDPAFTALAVLPLENFTGDAEQEFFVDGMTDALITDLSKVGSLTVISRTTAMRYKDSGRTLPQIAEELAVDAVVEGSVTRTGGRVQIKAQLVDADTDRPVWSQTFDRELAGVLTLQADVAKAIASTVRAALTPEEEERLTGGREVNPDSYQAYLRGMYWLNQGTPEGIERGLEFLHAAVADDPGDALAYAGLAIGYITVAHGSLPPADALDQAKSAALKAVRLDDGLAEAHASLAFLQGYYDWDWQLARQTLDRALEINPSLAIAHYHDAWFDVLFGRMEAAIAAHERAQRLDPLMPLHTAWLGQLYRMAGRFDDAIVEAERAIDMAPDFPVGHYVLGLTYDDLGRHAEALEAYERAATVAPDWRWALGPAHARAGRREEAGRIIAELEAQPIEPWHALWLATTHSQLGNLDEAFRWLSYERPHAFVPWVRIEPWARPLHGDPRFDELLERMNLPPVESPRP